MLTRLIYASAATGAVDPEVVQAILESARSFNLKHEITGMLCEGSGKFIQYLEGERQAVNDLYARLLADGRHKNLVLLDYAPIEERAYKDWSMGFVSVRNDDVMRLIEKSTQMRQFVPEQLNALQANSLINALKSQLYPQMALTGASVMDITGAKLH